MSIILSLSTLALRQVVDGACAAVGVKQSGEAVVGFLTERFSDHSQRLTVALQGANDKAWKALEISLAGDSLWDRCKSVVARGEDKAFGQQVRTFLDATPLPELTGKTAFRQKCLEELRAARKTRLLTGENLDPRQLAKQTADFARFGDPVRLLDSEWCMVANMASEIKQASYTSLAWLLSQRPPQGMPVLVVAVRYFFRRAVEEDQKLFQGLAFAKLEALGEAQEKGFAALSGARAQKGQRLEELLTDVKGVVVQTHCAVLDLQGQIKGQSEQIQQISQAVMKMLDQHQLQRREIRPADSMSIRNEGERKLVKQLVERYRSLPETERKQLPALLNAVGKLEVVAGDFDAAQKDFQRVAMLVEDTAAQAEAHFNAYQTAMERRDWTGALKELLSAVKLDAKRFAPFPVGKYHPQRILGAGGFGVAFSCRHKELKAEVVVKTLTSDDLDREVDEVFNEARVLYQLDHPAIIRLLDCGYTIPAENVHPYFVMNFFDGVSLEDYLQKNGPLSAEDLLAVARQMAEGLQAAHSKKILHRDVKPANVLVRKEETGWQVKLIDFGLALKHQVIEGAASTAKNKVTITGSSIAGTLDYGAPEQMGRLPGMAVGPYSDVYGWAKTCCYSLFKTTQPLPKHWKSLPESLACLLEDCLAEVPKDRPASFIKVLEALAELGPVTPKTKGERGTSKTVEKTEKNAVADEATAVAGSPQKTGHRLWPWAIGAAAALAMLVVVVAAIGIFIAMRSGSNKDYPPPVVESTPPLVETVSDKMKKEFHGKAVYDPATKGLKIRYDFGELSQLKDFVLDNAKPVIAQGALRLAPKDVIRHVAVFKTLTMQGRITIKLPVKPPQWYFPMGRHVYTSGGYGLSFRSGGGSFKHLQLLQNVKDNGEGFGFGYPPGLGGQEARIGNPTQFLLTVTKDRATLQYADVKIDRQISQLDVGQVELYGGDGGNVFEDLMLAGEVNEGWLNNKLDK